MQMPDLKGKKGLSLSDMYPAVLTLVVIGVVLGVGLVILAKFRDTLTAGSTEAKAVNDTLVGISAFGTTWIPIIVIAVAASIVLGLVLSGFGKASGR